MYIVEWTGCPAFCNCRSAFVGARSMGACEMVGSVR